MTAVVKKFTLIEVLIALAILSMAVVSFSLLIGGASKRTVVAFDRWQSTHLLTQAVEYYMLNEAQAGSDIDERFFPVEDYTAECSFESPEGLPEDVEESYGGQTLVAMKVVVKDKKGKTLDSATVERIIGDLQK
jgi:prepilin-type N-terminal cleavage/methylation domain-containing protein